MALSKVEKQVGVTVSVDATGALKAWKDYQKATDSARASTREFSEGLDVSNARIANQREALQKATATFAKAEAARQKSMQEATASFSSFTRAAGVAVGVLGGAAGLVGAATMAGSALNDLANQSVRTQDVFNNLAFSIGPARKATHEFIGDLELATYANQAAAIGIANSSQEFANFAGAVQKLAARAGTDTEQMFNSMIAAVGRGSTEMLDNAGIVLKTEQAHEIYARQLGKTQKELTETEKAEAFRKVAMQKIFEAAEQITITTDGAAAATKRYATEIANLKTAAMGGEDRVMSLREGLAKLNATQEISTNDLRTYGSTVNATRASLREMGVDTEALAKATRDDFVRGIEQARKAEESHMLTLASEGKLTTEYRGELERVISRLDAASLSAQGLGRALAGMQVQQAAEDMAKLQGALDLALAVEEANVAISLLDAHVTKGAAKAGGRADKFAAQRAQFEAALADSQRATGFDSLDRGEQTARGQFDEQLGIAQRNQAVAEAQAQHNAIMEDAEQAHLKRLEDARKKAHDAEIRRLAAEAKARNELLQKRIGAIGILDSVQSQSFALGLEGLNAMEMSEKRKAEIANKALGVQAFGLAAMESARAAAAFAALNPIQGGMHAAAAALATVKGGLLMSGKIGPQASYGAPSVGSGSSGGGFGGGGSGGRSTSGQSAPISRKGEQHASPAASSGGGGFNGTINFNSYLPADEEKMGLVIRRAIQHSGESFGSN